MTQFYVTLPSNACMTTFPTNTVSNYTTRLPSPLELSGQWEVGLVEIIYPRTWYNVLKGECYIDILNERGENHIRLPMQEGYYSSANEIIDTIKAILRGAVEGIDIGMGDTKTKVVINLERKTGVTLEGIDIGLADRTRKVNVNLSRNIGLRLSPELAHILGFEKTKLGSGRQHIGVSAADVNRAYTSLFVYCDLVQESIVGDTKAPLLRTLNVEGQYGDIVQKIYNNPIYVPLQKTHFDTVEINIKTENGQPVPFMSGKAIVTLHFRRSVNPYFLPRR
jgi:hypothetical protein